MTDPFEDPRVYASDRDLILLQHHTQALSFLPRQPIQSLLSGRHASRVRGRGLNFEELRVYQPGDDVRTIDWKVTARTRTAYTRVFTEERDRPVLMLVDQRIGMFFGTQRYMKSVLASQLAALTAWRVLEQGDRIGAIVFSDDSSDFFVPRRSRHCVTEILRSVVRRNRELSANSRVHANAAAFARVIEQASRLATHDYLVVIISDFNGIDELCMRHLTRIASHNDLIGLVVYDPSASDFRARQQITVSDGEWQLGISDSKQAQRITKATANRLESVLSLQHKLQAPMLPINTADEVLPQLRRLMGC
ncbi:MAG: DUF58 domain-containing protein [Planctomycetota bacterium]